MVKKQPVKKEPTKKVGKKTSEMSRMSQETQEAVQKYEQGIPQATEQAKAEEQADNELADAPVSKFVSNMKKALEKPTDHIIVEAYAGTGKTFTMIVGIAWVFGWEIWSKITRLIAERINEKAGRQKVDPNTFQIFPSEEQLAVWQEMRKSLGVAKTIAYCAFNKSIVNEFAEEWGWMVKLLQNECGITLTFNTVNSLGAKVIYKQYGKKEVKDAEAIEWHLSQLLSCELKDLRYNKKYSSITKAVVALVGHCKLSLIGWDEQHGFDPGNVTHGALDMLVEHFDIDLEGQRTQIYDLVPQVLDRCLLPESNPMIDWNDQNWLPIVKQLPITKVDLLMVDEGQDLPRCKQEFARLLGRRIMLVGDVNQAIYGFAGADVESIPRMRKLLRIDDTLRLTETRRCGKLIVAEAQKIVPDFRAHESNPEGFVGNMLYDEKLEAPATVGGTTRPFDKTHYMRYAQDGDMVLCRVNAPLVSQALKFIRNGKKAIIRGRDFGLQLINFIQKFETDNLEEFDRLVSNWANHETEKENKKTYPSEQKLMAVMDKRDCVLAFAEDVKTVSEITEKVKQVFAGKCCPKCNKPYTEEVETCYNCKTGEKDPVTGWDLKVKLVQPSGVLFSSIHKAKGLENKRVFFLMPKGGECPHPMAKSKWQKEQERNLLYVGQTRAIEELIYVK